MHKSLVQLSGQPLTLDGYLDDFERRFWQTDESGCWKIERQQEFAEPGDDSWEAFAQGDWDRALALMNGKRREITEYHKRIRKSGFDVRRVRVVQEPISPYLIWELNVLLIRYQCGARVRVVNVDQVRPFEENGTLPEIFILGRSTIYQVLYGEDGVAEGAIRTDDQAAIKQWTDLAKQLYSVGQEMDIYFQRNIQGRRPQILKKGRLVGEPEMGSE
jgi:hypothetical protein